MLRSCRVFLEVRCEDIYSSQHSLQPDSSRRCCSANPCLYPLHSHTITAGTDAYCKFTFAGGKPIKTKVVTRQGTSRHEINPEFNYEMWYPVSVPTMTQVGLLQWIIFLADGVLLLLMVVLMTWHPKSFCAAIAAAYWVV
jgi:hypothetical protein